MKQKFVQIAALCLSIALLMTAGSGTASAAAPNSNDRMIRVGLHYGTGAIEGLNLENGVGSGFRFGYYDNSNRFVELGSTAQRAISVVETQNVYYGAYGGYTCYHTTITSSIAVGVYHLQLPGVYSSFAEALAAASRYPGGFAAYVGGMYYARVGCYTSSAEASSAQAALGISSAELKWTSGYGVSVVATGTNTVLFQYDDNGQGTGLGVEPVSTGGEKCTTLSKGCWYNGGFRFERINGGRLTVVNILGLEDYIKGVVPTEMSEGWPIEALKAQAVAARSYAISLGAKHAAHHFDICYDVDCQAYTGQTRAGAGTNAAVDQTAGQVCLYNGQIAQTFYYSSNGGASESVSNVWGSNQSLYPYLVGVADPYEAGANVDNYWERTFTSAQIISRLLSGTNAAAPIVAAEVTACTDAGNPRLITFTDSAGKRFPVSSASVFQGLGLPSFRFGFKGTGGASQPAPAAPPVSSSGVSINGSAVVNGTSGLYAIDGSGEVSVLGGDVYVITESGASRLGSGGSQNPGGSQSYGTEWSSSATVVNGSITFAGRGWGHNIGMSQYGAYAMAQQGKTYQEILQFYYIGITVGYM